MASKEQEVRNLLSGCFGKEKPGNRSITYDRPMKDKDGKTTGWATYAITETELLQQYLDEGMSEEEARKKVEEQLEM